MEVKEKPHEIKVNPIISLEEVKELIKYKISDPVDDVELEISDYLKSRSTAQVTKAYTSGNSEFETYYSESEDFYFTAMKSNFNGHILERTSILLSTAIQSGVKTYSDWGAGAGRDCIAMSRIGIDVTHVDLIGSGTELASWRYKQRDLKIPIVDILNPPEKTYDLISNFDCLEHVDDPVQVLGKMLSRLNPHGIFFLVGDFYNFDLEKPKPHLPKNFVYGGVTQMVLEKMGLIKIKGLLNPWMETALAAPTIWYNPYASPFELKPLYKSLYKEFYNLVSTFSSFYQNEQKQLLLKLESYSEK